MSMTAPAYEKLSECQKRGTGKLRGAFTLHNLIWEGALPNKNEKTTGSYLSAELHTIFNFLKYLSFIS